MPSSTRAGLSPVMVGRAHELDRLRHLAAAGDGLRVVLLAGEAGVGKSRLVQELVASLPPRRRALVGRADESGAGHPYQLLLDAVAGDVRGWDRVPADLEPWSDPIGALLGPVAPRLTGAVRGYGPDELLGGAGELVRQLVGGDGAVVVFEDLHWADPDSLNLFRGLAAASDIDALLIGTFRPEGLDRPHVRELLAAVERLSQVEHIVLRRLDVDEVGSLVGAIRHTEVGYRVAADLHQRTAGNPFFLEQLLEAAGDTPVVSLVDQALPVSVTEAVLGRVESLDPDCRRVTEAAAVLGPRVDFDVLVEATGLDEDRLMSALRTAVAGGLLVEEETDLFSFRHALTREAVASRLLGRERRRLHEKALDMLRRAGSKDWATIAHHAAGAGRTGEMVEAARLGAAHHLRMGATYQALRLADAALAEEDDDVDLLETAARASWAVGLSRSALDRAEQWRRRSELEGDLESMSRSLRLIARLRWETGDRDGHAEAVAAAADLAEKLPIGPERGWVANLVCESAMLRGDHAAAVAVADEALTVAGEPPPPDLQAAVLVNKGSALIATVEGAEEGEALLLRAIDAAEQVQDWLSALRAVNNLSHSVLPLWEPERSWELIDRMGALIARSGRQDWTSSWHGLRAVWHAHVVGDLAAARAEAAVGGLGWARSWWGRAVDA
ncbi:MAG TPA: AAA family ATPase, partial [Acidimicrobiales bacterium]|nr:AAA family ATPase [Acidimicrobiales bacterium]